jgi:hypothetical protein
MQTVNLLPKRRPQLPEPLPPQVLLPQPLPTSSSASAHTIVSTVLQSFHNNGIVNNNVTVFEIPGNESLPECNVKQPLDGKVHLPPDKFVPLESNEISDERRKNELLKAWRFA